MSTRFFIGGNEFYGEEEDAQKALAEFLEKYGIPPELFSIVIINKFDS